MVMLILVSFLIGLIVSPLLRVWLGSGSVSATLSHDAEKTICKPPHNPIVETKTMSTNKPDIIPDHLNSQKNGPANFYTLRHQRLNKTNEWVTDKSNQQEGHDEEFEFTVYYRHERHEVVPRIQTFVEIHDVNLKSVLARCVRYVESVFDEKPLVCSSHFVSNNE
jgi:hypothetical protein